MKRGDLLQAESHFKFGENWASYADLIGKDELTEAVKGLRRLLGDYDLAGRSFLDIGCGSGIHCVSALEMGASYVVAVDIDPDSVATTSAVLEKYAPAGTYRVELRSVFDLDPESFGQFDVVYSWGVLHHTGDMVSAIRRATSLVKDGGLFLVALYRRTHMCPLWKLEKRWYSSASERSQRLARQAYVSCFRTITSLARATRRLRGKGGIVSDPNFEAFVRDYKTFRGMDFHHDVHDWLGGYPYESILPDEVDALMRQLGLQQRAAFLCTESRGITHGLLGSGCDEYGYVKDCHARLGENSQA